MSASKVQIESEIKQQFEEALLLLDFPAIVKSESPELKSRKLSPESVHEEIKLDLPDLPIDREDHIEMIEAASLLIKGSQEDSSPRSKITSKKISSNSIGVEKKKKKSPTIAFATNENGEQRSCNYCQTITTPMWRHGPSGYADLCNKVFDFI